MVTSCSLTEEGADGSEDCARRLFRREKQLAGNYGGSE